MLSITFFRWNDTQCLLYSKRHSGTKMIDITPTHSLPEIFLGPTLCLADLRAHVKLLNSPRWSSKVRLAGSTTSVLARATAAVAVRRLRSHNMEDSLWYFETKRLLHKLPSPNTGLCSACFSRECCFKITGSKSTVHLFDYWSFWWIFTKKWPFYGSDTRNKILILKLASKYKWLTITEICRRYPVNIKYI